MKKIIITVAILIAIGYLINSYMENNATEEKEPTAYELAKAEGNYSPAELEVIHKVDQGKTLTPQEQKISVGIAIKGRG